MCIIYYTRYIICILKLYVGKIGFTFSWAVTNFFKQYFFFKSFFLFSWHSGLPLHPNLMYTCNLYWRKMDTDIYLQYLHVELSKKIILIFSAKPYTKSNPYHPTTPGGIIAWEKYKIIFHAKILTICFMRIVITILKSNYKYVHRYIIVVLTYTYIVNVHVLSPGPTLEGANLPSTFQQIIVKNWLILPKRITGSHLPQLSKS